MLIADSKKAKNVRVY